MIHFKRAWNFTIAFVIVFLNALTLVPNILYNLFIWIIIRHDLDFYFDKIIEIICFDSDNITDDKFPFFKLKE